MEKQILLLLSLCFIPAISMETQEEQLALMLIILNQQPHHNPPPFPNPNRQLFGPRNPNQQVEINFEGSVIGKDTILHNTFNNSVSKKKAPKDIPVPNFSCFGENNNNDILKPNSGKNILIVNNNNKNSPKEPNNTNYDYCPPTLRKKRTNNNDNNKYLQTHKRDKK